MIHSTTGNLIKNGITAFILFFFISIVHNTFGQVFPVQANINVTPPYTVYLSNYTSPQQQRVMVNILLHDPVVTSVDVRFKFSVEGGGIRLYTNPGWIPQPFILAAGIPSLLTADIIAEYFQPQHLIVEGVNPQEFFRSGKLPEGFYQFKVEVLEYQRGVTISNVARTGVWLLLNEAPKMVFPTPNQKVLATNPQMLNFSWIPGGIASPLSVQTTMYEFTMVELQDGMDPTVAITTASDAIKYVRTTQQTSLLYGPSEPQLMPGKRYAIRIKAYNTDGYEVFKNNGYSDVRVFQFGDACNPPILFTLADETQSTFSINVTTNPGNTSWVAQFRENTEDVDINGDADSWSELKPEMGVAAKTVKGLKSSTAYQVQVKAICGGYTSDFLPVQTVTTTEKVNSNRSCNNSTPVIDIPNAQPLEKLKPNDLFLAALFPIKVTEVTKQSGGKFTGKGVATLPLFNAGLAVSFADVGINEAYILTSGEVIADRNETGITLFGDELPPTGGTGDGTGTITGLDTTGTWPPFTDTISIDVPFDSIVVVNDSTIWVIPTGGGEAIVVDLGGSTCTLITPPDGNMDNAQVVYNGAAKPYRSGSGNNGSEQEQFTGFLANFSASNDQRFGFDSLRIQKYTDYYNEMIVNGKTVKLPWKALASGQIDPVNLKIRRSADTYPYSNLKISILGGTDLQPVVGANTASQTYSLTGATDGDETPIVATFTEDGKTKYAGGIWTATYQPQSFKLFIVPFPKVDISEGEIGQLQNGLNQIYSQAVVSWDVKPMNGFTGIDLGDNGLDWVESDMLSSYDSEMNSVISAFKDWKENPDPDAYYLFIVPKFSEKTIEGFMPRNRRFGFIPVDEFNARTVAHELGHGAFNLRHTFPEATQGSTDNLMDYTQDKYSLLKAQWDLIHNPETTTGLFDDMEDGASTTTPVNDAWTALFNHIQNNNNSLQHSYLDKILKESKDFDLNPDPDNLKWSYGTRDFMSKWQIRALDIDKDKTESNSVSTNELNAGSTLNKIFDAIRIANDGEKIGKIELKSKKIYLGKVEFKGKEYFFALYGNGVSTTLENVFTKRQVGAVTDLEDKTHVYSIYCDDTPNNYMIIGFLESGKSEPSMAIQISKAGLTDWPLSKEEWLENLNIYKPNDKKETDGLLTLYNGDNEVKEPANFFQTIKATPDPVMPKNLKIMFNGSTGEKANITVKISYRITYSYKSNTYPFDDGNTTIEIKDAEANKQYPITFSSIRGGTVTVTCETENKRGTLKFNIRGENPSQSEIMSYVQKKGASPKYWFIKGLISHESNGFQQFYDKNSSTFALIDEKKTYDGPLANSKGQKGLPLYGGPKGFGLSQLDGWGDNKVCSGEQRWNWKANIDGGLEVLEEKVNTINKVGGAHDSWFTTISEWDKKNPNNKVEAFADFTLGGTTFTYAKSPYFDWNYGTLSAGKRSFLDANLIKLYNGGYLISLIKPKPYMENGVEVKPAPYWEFVKDEKVDRKTYVIQVLSEN